MNNLDDYMLHFVLTFLDEMSLNNVYEINKRFKHCAAQCKLESITYARNRPYNRPMYDQVRAIQTTMEPLIQNSKWMRSVWFIDYSDGRQLLAQNRLAQSACSFTTPCFLNIRSLIISGILASRYVWNWSLSLNTVEHLSIFAVKIDHTFVYALQKMRRLSSLKLTVKNVEEDIYFPAEPPSFNLNYLAIAYLTDMRFLMWLLSSATNVDLRLFCDIDAPYTDLYVGQSWLLTINTLTCDTLNFILLLLHTRHMYNARSSLKISTSIDDTFSFLHWWESEQLSIFIDSALIFEIEFEILDSIYELSDLINDTTHALALERIAQQHSNVKFSFKFMLLRTVDIPDFWISVKADIEKIKDLSNMLSGNLGYILIDVTVPKTLLEDTTMTSVSQTKQMMKDLCTVIDSNCEQYGNLRIFRTSRDVTITFTPEPHFASPTPLQHVIL